MRNVFIAFGVLAIVGVILTLWPASIPGIDAQKVTNVKGFIDLIAAALGIYTSLKTQMGEPASVEESLFKTVSLDDLRKGVGPVAWVDRGAVSTSHLKSYGRILLLGKPGMGKSREAAELVKSAVAEELIPADQVYTVEARVWRSSPGSAAKKLSASIDTDRPAVILVDGLPITNRTQALKDLDQAFASLRPFQDIYIVVTATPDEGLMYKAWFDRQGFRQIQLLGLNGRQTGQLISSAAKAFKLNLDESAREVLLKMRDGTPASTLLTLRHLQRSGKKRITAKLAKEAARANLTVEQEAARRIILNRMPSLRYFLFALDSFRAAEIKPETERVLDYAEHLWKKEAGLRQFIKSTPVFRQEFPYLSTHNILDEDGVIVYPAGLTQTPADPEQARQELVAFLERAERPSLQERFDRTERIAGRVSWLIVVLAFSLILAVIEIFSVVGALAIFKEQINIITLVQGFWLFVGLYAVIGFVRGWAEELLVMFFILAALPLVSLLANGEFGSEFMSQLSPTASFVVIGSIIAMGAFVGYGTVLVIPRLSSSAPRARMQGGLLGALVGGLNGYLVVGSLLYYLLAFRFQIAGLTFPSLDLDAGTLDNLVSFLPPELLGTPGAYWALLIILILIVIVFI